MKNVLSNLLTQKGKRFCVQTRRRENVNNVYIIELTLYSNNSYMIRDSKESETNFFHI